MGKGIGTDNGLVGLHHDTGDGRQQLAGGIDVLGDHLCTERHDVLAGAQGHDHLFEGTVAGPLADAVDGALDLLGPGLYCGQRVGYCQTEIVMTMYRQDRLVDIGHMLLEILDDIEVLGRDSIANSIGNVHHFGTGGNDLLHHLGEKGQTGPNRILCGEFNIWCITGSSAHGSHGGVEHLLFTHLELILQVNVASGNESMNPGPFPGWFESLPSAVDIQVAGTAEAADLTAAGGFGDPFDGFKIPFGSDRKAGLDDIDIKLFELSSDTQFLVDIHAGAGRLLAVAQGSIKNLDSLNVIHVTSRGSVVHPIQRCRESCVE